MRTIAIDDPVAWTSVTVSQSVTRAAAPKRLNGSRSCHFQLFELWNKLSFTIFGARILAVAYGEPTTGLGWN